MAEVIEDPKKKKASFGDAAAAATDPGITQLNVGRPGDFPVNPDGTPMQKMAAPNAGAGALPPATQTEKPPGFATTTLAPAAGALPPSAPIDPQTLSDRQAVGRVWDGIKSMNRSAGAAIADVATLPLRGVVGAYDSAVVRPMRAAGVNAAYLSPKLVPDGANVDSMTPFYDQIRSRENALAQAQAVAPTAAPKVIPGAGDATMPGNDPTRFMAPAQSDAPNPTAEGKDVGFGVRRIDAPGKSPLFTNVASAADNAALQGRGSISAQNMGAAQGLSDTFAAEGRAAAQKAQYDQEVATAQAINARLIPKDTGGYGLLSKEYQDRRNASFAPSSLVGDTARNAAIIAQGAALDAQALQGVRNEGEAARAEIHEGGSNSRAALQEQGQNTRFGALQTIAKQRLALDSKTQGAQAAQYGAEARLKGVQANAAEQLAALQNKYMAAKPEEQAAIAKQIRTLSNKADKAQLLAVNQPDTMAPDGMTKLGGGQRLVVQGEDGSFREVPMGGEQAAGISADARAIAIRDNKSMSVDEKRKQLQALGYK